MKKLLFFCLAICACVGCQKTNEDKVKDAFKEYVSKNFNDPDAIKEIVSIDSVDTFSTIQIKKDITSIYQIYDSIRIVKEQKDNDFSAFLKDRSKTSQLPKGMVHSNHRFKSLMVNYFQLLENDIQLATQSAESASKGDYRNVYDMDSEYEELMSKKDTIFCAQVLSYRMKDKDGLKLHRTYVLCDTLYNYFCFGDEIPSEYSQLMSDFNYFNNKYKRDYDINIKKIGLLNSMFSILKNEYNVTVEEK